MINGVITSNREAVIRINVQGCDGQEIMMDAAIDTGFNGFLTLPIQYAANLNLPFGQSQSNFLQQNP